MSDVQRREVAYRLFATEFDDATLSHQEADEERAPNYVITPTGARVNRLFVVGVLTEVEQVNDDVLRARVVDPTGGFVVYAGQYQPDELAALERLDPPTFVAVTGKARTFTPDDSDRVYTSVRPESISEVDADTRDRWVVDAAEQTLERVATYAVAAGLDERGDDLRVALESKGVAPGLADGVPRAMDHYATTPGYLSALRETALDAVRVVAGDRDEVPALSVGPADEGDGSATWADLADRERAAFGASAVPGGETAGSGPEEAAEAEAGVEAETGAGAEEPAAPEADATTDEAAASSDDETAESETAGDEDETGSETVGVGDFEPGDLGGEASETETSETKTAETEAAETETAETETAETEAADAEATPKEVGGGMYEMDDEEREELEAEFGAEFTSGTEVDDPGEADIESPEPESDEATADEPEPESDEATADEPETETEEAAAAEAAEEAAADAAVDLDEHLLTVMAELDGGDGADRDELVDRVADETGASEADVEDAIQDALIGGQCYEPDDGKLKAI
ncbi:RPA family protein [Haloarchaeobius sp. HRN-SO-5]|uniref:RPA family protein n=1 Tax=Haloarchaeobius sp. HRN-SO-5 TaxID=3446118 RepID=UPI003EBB36AB